MMGAPVVRTSRCIDRALHAGVIALAARGFVLALLALVFAVTRAPAQATNDRVAAARDSAMSRAQQLAARGDSTTARHLVDSVLATTREGTSGYADALYIRALLAADREAGERDYIRLVVDYGLTPRAADALLKLAQIHFESDRAAARAYLDRLILEHPDAPAAAEGWFLLSRVRVADGDALEACVALDSARAHLAPTAVERRAQLDFSARSCRVVMQRAADSSGRSPGRGDSAANTAGASAKDSTARGNTRSGQPAGARSGGAAATADARWSVQVAAYKTKAEADALARRLQSRGYSEARVDKLELYHVRIGIFRSRAEATALVNRLKQQGTTAIVVEAPRRER
jgi:cell division septation protein DedD